MTEKDFDVIKRLLILLLYTQKASVDDIAKAAGISKRDLYKIIPKKRN